MAMNGVERAADYLRRLCLDIPERPVGSAGNRAATDFFAERLAAQDFEIERAEFDCLDWRAGAVQLTAPGQEFDARISPYSPGCRVTGPLAVVTSVDELAQADLTDTIVLLRGPIAKEQLLPKNFPFYQVAEHQHLLQLLETKQPLAILAATSHNPEMVGGLSPFPLIEDGDFDIPSAYLTEGEGERLAQQAGQEVRLTLNAQRIPARSCNVIARKGSDPLRRVVAFAHIDSKAGTPGALDNAAGVVTLVLLAEALRAVPLHLRLELVALNGEDHYSNPGEVRFLADNHGKFGDIVLGINIDGVGYRQGGTAFSLYHCPDPLAGQVRRVFASQPGLSEGTAWYQGDHMLFVQNQVPAVALTSECALELLATIVHTPHDRPELIDSTQLAWLAQALRQLVLDLDRALTT